MRRTLLRFTPAALASRAGFPLLTGAGTPKPAIEWRAGPFRRRRAVVGAWVSAAVLLVSTAAHAQRGAGEPVDAAMRAKMVDQVSAALNETYVFPEVAKKMEASLRKKLKAGAYGKISNSAELAEVFTRDLREVSRDKHLSVDYAPSPPPGLGPDGPPSPEARENMRRELAARNFGFEKVERLAGNVGYLELRGFMGAELAGETAIAAMGFLANSDALIIDLRRNGGGHPSMVQLISSYFFDEPQHLNSFYIRKGNITQQFWTSAHVAGKRMTEVPIYVLTSERTFSAAEEFTYNLKNLKRATIVGETTGGGAHPVRGHYLSEVRLLVRVPFGRAVNPITGTNWEGTGVTPDLQVPADKALETAHQEALKKLRDGARDDARKQQFSWALQEVEARARPATLTAEVLKSFAGTYGPSALVYENGALFYEWRKGSPRARVVPMTADTLMLDGLDFLRLRIEKDTSGRVTGLSRLYDDGNVDKVARSGG